MKQEKKDSTTRTKSRSARDRAHKPEKRKTKQDEAKRMKGQLLDRRTKRESRSGQRQVIAGKLLIKHTVANLPH